ncbi:hypothetical protein ABZ540_33490 [Nocardia xishanensis]|uniref:hypothetical protein n=1 Tax=Nocardia xishanensis TaxID=238964 RepID=UPI0033F9F1E5
MNWSVGCADLNEIGPTVSDEVKDIAWGRAGQVVAAKLIADWLFTWLRRHFDP